MKKLLTGTGLLLLLLVAPTFAAPMGPLSTANCTGQGVTVTFGLIDWLPAGGDAGCINTAQPTNVSYVGGGPLVEGVEGTIKDIAFGVGAITDFMTFEGHPNLSFDLLTLGPGVANTVCANSLDPNAPACSIAPGSPFVLRAGPGGTTVDLAAFGTARDNSDILSNWGGTFSVSFAGLTPAQLQAQFFSTGSITSSHSASFTVTPIPEPATTALIGCGMLFVAYLGRRSRRKA